VDIRVGINPKMIKQALIVVVCALLLGGCTDGSGDYYSGGRYDERVIEDPDPVITSDNWDCTGDCSGHEAGYEWASDNGISDPDDCGGKSNSFIEGCEAYANEQLMQAEEDVQYAEEDEGYSYY